MTQVQVRRREDGALHECPLHEAGDLISSGEWVLVKVIDVPVAVNDTPAAQTAASPSGPVLDPEIEGEEDEGQGAKTAGRRGKRK